MKCIIFFFQFHPLALADAIILQWNLLTCVRAFCGKAFRQRSPLCKVTIPSFMSARATGATGEITQLPTGQLTSPTKKSSQLRLETNSTAMKTVTWTTFTYFIFPLAICWTTANTSLSRHLRCTLLLHFVFQCLLVSAGCEGPILVLLHGGGFSGLTWSLFAADIVKKVKCRTFAIDLRGHGETESTDDLDLSSQTMAHDIVKGQVLLRALDCETRF